MNFNMIRKRESERKNFHKSSKKLKIETLLLTIDCKLHFSIYSSVDIKNNIEISNFLSSLLQKAREREHWILESAFYCFEAQFVRNFSLYKFYKVVFFYPLFKIMSMEKKKEKLMETRLKRKLLKKKLINS